MNKLKKVKNNKGFSLVELIVVIVILAILIGVTVGGIYSYVNKSRTNTDVNNASSISSVLATIATDEDVYKELKKDTKYKKLAIKWDATLPNEYITNLPPEARPVDYAIFKKLQEIFTDGLPALKANGSFKIENRMKLEIL